MHKVKISLIKYLVLFSSYLYFWGLRKKLYTLKNKAFSLYFSRKFLKTGPSFYVESSGMIVGAKYISVGDNFQAFGRLRMEAIDCYLDSKFSPSITIGKDVSINFDCHIAAINQIVIGNGVLIGSKVLITDHAHGSIASEDMCLLPAMRKLNSKGPVVIGNNVWIGESVVILPGVTIGENSIIGANSVVTRDVKENAVFAGIPAKLVKDLGI
jgi:acetyltransferase-like isoleucine patch superfamily enzyme